MLGLTPLGTRPLSSEWKTFSVASVIGVPWTNSNTITITWVPSAAVSVTWTNSNTITITYGA